MTTKPFSHFTVGAPSESSGFLLWQVTSRWQQVIKKALREFGLTHTQFVLLASMLWFSERKEPVYQIKLSSHTCIDPMTTSMVLRTLEKKGYVTRADDRNDTRAKNIALTSAGKSCAKKIVKKVEECDRAFFERLGSRSRDFNALMEGLVGRGK